MSEQENETQAPDPLAGWDEAKVVTRYKPDEGSGPFKTISEAQAAGHDTIDPVTGVWQLAVVVHGHPVVVVEEQAAQVRALSEAAKAAHEAKTGA